MSKYELWIGKKKILLVHFRYNVSCNLLLYSNSINSALLRFLSKLARNDDFLNLHREISYAFYVFWTQKLYDSWSKTWINGRWNSVLVFYMSCISSRRVEEVWHFEKHRKRLGSWNQRQESKQRSKIIVVNGELIMIIFIYRLINDG